MSRSKYIPTHLLFLLLFVFLVTACGNSSEDNGNIDGDSTDITCNADNDCPTDSNYTCNTTAQACIDHGACQNDSECDSWYGQPRPYCNDGMCEIFGGNTDGDDVVDGDDIIIDGDAGDTCSDFSGLYDGEFACATTENYDTWVAVDYINCTILIYYNDSKISGTISGENIEITDGKSCTGSGIIAGNITLSCDDSCNITLSPKTSTGTDGEIYVQYSHMNFGAVSVGMVGELSNKISNVGTGAFTILDIFMTDDTSSEFKIIDPENRWVTPREFDYGKEDDLNVKYAPTEEAAKTGMIFILSDAKNQPVTKIKLTSEVKASPKIEVDPTAINFGTSPPGYDNKKYFLIKNTGGASGQITNIEVENDANGAYTVIMTPEIMPPFYIEAGYSVSVNMNFAPIDGVHPAPSNQVGKACITWKDRNETDQKTCIDLLGQVTELQPACIDITPLGGVPGMWGLGDFPGPGIKYGYSAVGGEIIRNVEITNCGDLPLELNTFAWNDLAVGPPLTLRAFFEKPGDFRNYTLNRGEKLYLPISYYPITEGSMNTAAFMFNTNAAKFAWTTDGTYPADTPVNVGVSGIAARRGIEVLPNKIDFGLITLECCSRPEEITVYNIGNLVLEIAEIQIGGGSDELFELVDLPPTSEYPIALGGGENPQSLRFKVKFCPTHEGSHDGRIEITSNDDNASQFIVPLKGEGTLLSHQVDEFNQAEYPMVDILWVIDCSGSMNEEQDKLADNFDDFIREAVSWSADLHVAVIGADTVTEGAGGSGQFYGSPPFLSSDMTDADMISKFKNYATRLTACNGDESGLQASYMALSEPKISNENIDFLRSDAKLSIIYVSDEPDQSVAEIPFFIDFLRNIKGMRNTTMIEVYAIVGDKPSGCEAGEAGDATAGPRYIAVADACNINDDMHFMSICAASYAPVFQNLAENLFARPNQFFLSRLADESTIVVKVDGATHYDWEYDEVSNSVIFDEAPGAGASIVIEYDTVCLH